MMPDVILFDHESTFDSTRLHGAMMFDVLFASFLSYFLASEGGIGSVHA